MTASFRALYERLIFQNLTYNLETPCCNPRPVPVLLIMTSNAPDTAYRNLVENYRQTLENFLREVRETCFRRETPYALLDAGKNFEEEWIPLISQSGMI